MTRWMPLFVLASLALFACAPDETEHVDAGRACLRGEPGQAHEVTVDFQLCLSSSCDELVDDWCTATLDGDTITVESSVTVRSTGRMTCTADCQQPITTCQTPPLAAGTYTLVYGEQELELMLPLPTDDEALTCTAEGTL